MRLLSFDVGIKNLAYCILEKKNSSLEILEWNVINLCDSESSSEQLKCQIVLKTNKKVCGKTATYKKNNIYCCNTHAKQNTKYIIPSKQHSISYLKKQKVEVLRELLKLTGTCTTPKNKMEVIDALNNYYNDKSWEIISIAKKTNASKIDLITVGRKLHTALSENQIIKTVTHVVIENQISPIANRMKTLQGMIAQHFISNGVNHIEFVSSSNKLKGFEDQSEEKTSYQKNKKNGIYYCEKLLRKYNLSNWNAYFSQYGKKKDDLADCFLQGIWFLEKI